LPRPCGISLAVAAFGSTTGSLWVSEDQGDTWQTVSEHLPPIDDALEALLDDGKAVRGLVRVGGALPFSRMWLRPRVSQLLRRYPELRLEISFGAPALVDESSKRYLELGLRTARYGDERWLEILIDEPLILKMPLVRHGNALTIGAAETTWKSWLAKG